MDAGIGQFIPLILIFVIFYFFLIRPQQKKVKEHKLMVEGLKRGDMLHSVVSEFGEELPEKVCIRDQKPVQFARYFSEIARGDLGNSYQRPKSGMMGQGGDFNANMDVEMAEVSDLIFQTLPYTLQLAGLALLIKF